MATLITFDVDGTLIHSIGKNSNALHKEAFSAAFEKAYGVKTHIDLIKHHGGTDPLILLKVLAELYQIDPRDAMANLEDMKAHMVEYYLAHLDRSAEGLEVLPGVSALLRRLKQAPNVYVGLVTGNLEPIAWAKMHALGLKEAFTRPHFGGFGSDFCSGNISEMHHDRAELIRIAATKVPDEIARAYHVGDAPSDVRAAKAAGVTPVGVTTGIFSASELAAAVPEAVIIDGFSDPCVAMSVFNLQNLND